MQTLKIKGFGTLICRTKEGKEKWRVDFNNTITNAGLAQIALLAGDATATPFTYLELGTSSTAPAASQTALQAAITDTGLERAAATVARTTTTQTNDTLMLSHTWTATGAKSIEEVGIFNAASAGTMLGRALTSTRTVANGETIEGIYKVKFA